MGSNVEIKARARECARLAELAERLSGMPGQVIRQEDVFFRVPHGRLKLRRLSASHGQLVYYDRADAAGPTRSSYWICPTDEPDRLERVLTAELGVAGVVRKVRRLYLVGQTRVHLDDVEGLGTFVELEVVMQPGQTTAEVVQVAQGLMQRLGVREEDLIDRAYVDLLAEVSGGSA